MAHQYSPSAADLDKVAKANASGRQPAVFVHGLWLLDSSWNHWGPFFEDAGYSAKDSAAPAADRPGRRGSRGGDRGR